MVGAESPLPSGPVKPLFPELVSVTSCTLLVVPTIWLPKLTFGGLSVTTGESPVPLRATVNVVLAVPTV